MHDSDRLRRYEIPHKSQTPDFCGGFPFYGGWKLVVEDEPFDDFRHTLVIVRRSDVVGILFHFLLGVCHSYA